MPHFGPVTFTFKEPLTGTVAAGENYASWTISEVTFNFCRDEKPQPPHWLVFKLHAELVDKNGEEVPVQVLSLLDLEGGMREVFEREFRAAWDAVETSD